MEEEGGLDVLAKQIFFMLEHEGPQDPLLPCGGRNKRTKHGQQGNYVMVTEGEKSADK